jgi:hypothetical protein
MSVISNSAGGSPPGKSISGLSTLILPLPVVLLLLLAAARWSSQPGNCP